MAMDAIGWRRHFTSGFVLRYKFTFFHGICTSADRLPGLQRGKCAGAGCNVKNSTITAEQSGDLFGKLPVPRGGPVVKAPPSPELTAARALCHQIRLKRAPSDKQRIAHLICLNLLSMLKHGKYGGSGPSS